MNSWTITNLDLKPHSPEILASTDEARAIALMIPAGQSFDDHQVHESAGITVIDGEVDHHERWGECDGSTGLVVAFGPNERHAVHARSDTRLLLLLTPWPGVDHPGAMTWRRRRTPATTPPNAERPPDAKTRNRDLSRMSHRYFGERCECSVGLVCGAVHFAVRARITASPDARLGNALHPGRGDI